MTRAIPTGLNRRKASGRACPAASTRASHSGCSWSRYGSSETTLTVASATPSPVSWISSWYRGGSTASRAASSCGSRASRTATLFTGRWYGAAPGRGIHRKAEPAAATAGGGGAASRPPAATPVRAGNSPCCPLCRGGPPDHHDGMDFTTSARPGLRAPAAAPAPALTPAPWAGIALIAVAAVAVEMAVSARYGYVRDELYFLSAGQHLAFGYVDQPPLTPLLARITAALTGGTLAGFRILPALCLAALVVMTAAMSRRLGAGRTGQLLAALAAATCAEYLGAMHELTTTTPDFVFWALILLLVMRLLASRDPRWWLAIGGCAGVASEAKWNIAFLLAGLAAGFLLTDARRLLASRYLLIGGLLAAALAAPDVVWQAGHGWPGLDVFRVLQTSAGHNRAVFWPAQVLYIGPVLTPVWVGGAVWSLRNAAARPFRPAASRSSSASRAGASRSSGASRAGASRSSGASRAERPGAAGSRLRSRPGRRWWPARYWPRRWRCPCCRPGPCTPRRCRRSTTTSARRSPGPASLRWLQAITTRCRPRSGRGLRSWPGITARRERSTATAPATACRRPTAAPTTSGSGARRPPLTLRRWR